MPPRYRRGGTNTDPDSDAHEYKHSQSLHGKAYYPIVDGAQPPQKNRNTHIQSHLNGCRVLSNYPGSHHLGNSAQRLRRVAD